MTTRAPSATNRSAIARPRPLGAAGDDGGAVLEQIHVGPPGGGRRRCGSHHRRAGRGCARGRPNQGSPRPARSPYRCEDEVAMVTDAGPDARVHVVGARLGDRRAGRRPGRDRPAAVGPALPPAPVRHDPRQRGVRRRRGAGLPPAPRPLPPAVAARLPARRTDRRTAGRRALPGPARAAGPWCPAAPGDDLDLAGDPDHRPARDPRRPPARLVAGASRRRWASGWPAAAGRSGSRATPSCATT